MRCCSNTVHFLGFMKYMQGVVTFPAHTLPSECKWSPIQKMPKVFFRMLPLPCGRLLYFDLFLSGVFFFPLPFGVYVFSLHVGRTENNLGCGSQVPSKFYLRQVSYWLGPLPCRPRQLSQVFPRIPVLCPLTSHLTITGMTGTCYCSWLFM